MLEAKDKPYVQLSLFIGDKEYSLGSSQNSFPTNDIWLRSVRILFTNMCMRLLDEGIITKEEYEKSYVHEQSHGIIARHQEKI